MYVSFQLFFWLSINLPVTKCRTPSLSQLIKSQTPKLSIQFRFVLQANARSGFEKCMGDWRCHAPCKANSKDAAGSRLQEKTCNKCSIRVATTRSAAVEKVDASFALQHYQDIYTCFIIEFKESAYVGVKTTVAFEFSLSFRQKSKKKFALCISRLRGDQRNKNNHTPGVSSHTHLHQVRGISWVQINQRPFVLRVRHSVRPPAIKSRCRRSSSSFFWFAFSLLC